LKSQIHLIGALSQADLDHYYCSADYFILGSHYEGSGYSLIESLACGCIPIVTDIPSFRRITNEGKIGRLWQPGDVKSLKAAITHVLEKDKVQASERAKDFFEQELSFAAIARQQIKMMDNILTS
jgi:glycosyltransferase involved in cell wall biosynthesis